MVQDIISKLIVTQLVQKYPASLWNPMVHYRAHKSPPLDPILGQLNPVHFVSVTIYKYFKLGQCLHNTNLVSSSSSSSSSH
jgi:hypothetical protein